MSDDLNLDDGVEINETEKEQIGKTPAGIEKSIAQNLSAAEQQKIEENKKKHKDSKKTTSQPSEEIKKDEQKGIDDLVGYSKDELSVDELKFGLELQDELVSFIEEKAKISPGTGVKYLLPTGVDLLDVVAGGGFAAGAVTLIIGNPGTFKSALLAQTIATSQKKYRGKVLNTFMDSEEAMTTNRLISLGVKNPPIKPHPAASVEDVFKTVETICAFKELKELQDNPSIVAWDSLANTITEKEKSSDEMDINKFIGLKARVISILLPKYVAKLQEYNIGLIIVNQLREKIDMGFFPTANDLRWLGDKNIPGGNALKYNAFHMLLLKIKTDLKVEEYGFTGVLMEAKFVKNKLFQPNITVQLVVDFNKGVSNLWTNWNMLVTHKRGQSSAWSKLISLPAKTFRKRDLPEKYKNDKEFRDEFDRNVKEVLQTEYIDKYSSSQQIAEVQEKLESISEQK